MKVFLTIIRYLLVFLLTLAILSISIIVISNITVLNKEFILSKIDETNYYTEINKQVQSNFKKYIYQSGLPENILDNVVSEEKVKEDTMIIVDNLYDGLDKKIDTTEIKTKINKNIEEYIQNTQQTIPKEQEKSIEEFVSTICEEYTTTISHTQYEHNINETYNKICKYVDYVKKATLIILVVLIAVILGLTHKEICKGIANIGIALTSSGLFYIFTKFFIEYKIKIDTITILNNAFSTTLRSWLKGIVEISFKCGCLLFGVGILIIIFSNILNKKSTNKKNKKETQE